uniref:Nuclear cap-binding protein subunit 1 n=1 Tax=Dracunculus medinensis TaxID=318479 RepID=A0A158Q3I3_DRAME
LFELITHVGEKSNSSLESNLESLAQVLETDLNTYKDDVIKIVYYCVSHMPCKLTIYSTLVGLLNAKKYEFGEKLLIKILKKLEEHMNASHFSICLNLMTFLADLVNTRVVTLSSFADFLEDLVQEAFEDNIPQVRSDWFIYAILHCLPWVGREMFERKKDILESILDAVEGHMMKRNKSYVEMLRVWTSSIHEQEDYLDCLWAQIMKLRSDDWTERHIMRHYVAFDGQLADALQHNLPKFIPTPHSSSNVYPLPHVVFRLFDYADCPEQGPLLPGAHSIERFLMEEEINWIILENQGNRKECATNLLDYHKKSTVPLNYVILEVIFSQLFRIPDSPIRPIFYGSLLIELCKTKTMPQVIAQAAELLYQRIDTMQLICIDRLVDWFSYHMSNFEYRWSWNDWSSCIEMDHLAPRHIFVREVLEKCVRLSYRQRILEVLPIGFEKMVPEKISICYDLGDEDHPLHSLAVEIEKGFRGRVTAENMIEIIQRENDRSGNECLIIFFSVLLNLARKTFSHNFAALTKYYITFKKLIGESEELQLLLLQTLYDVWKLNHQMVIVITTKLLKMSVIDASSVAAWIFSEKMKVEFLRMWIWELLCIALDHVTGELNRVRSQIEKLRNKMDYHSDEQNRDEGDFSDKEKDEENNDDGNIEDLPARETEAASLQECLKNLLLYILHKFIILMSEHIVNSEMNGSDIETSWFVYIDGRLQNVFQRVKFWCIYIN